MWPDGSEQGAKWSDIGWEWRAREGPITQEPFDHERDWGLYPMIVGRSLPNFEQEYDD